MSRTNVSNEIMEITNAIFALTKTVKASCERQDADHEVLMNLVEEMKETRKGAVSNSKNSKSEGTTSSEKKLVEFVKKDGTVKMVTEKQKRVYENWQNRSLDDAKACVFDGKFTSKMDKWIVEHPTCTCKAFKAQFKDDAKGCTKDQLKAHKTQMRAEKKMK